MEEPPLRGERLDASPGASSELAAERGRGRQSHPWARTREHTRYPCDSQSVVLLAREEVAVGALAIVALEGVQRLESLAHSRNEFRRVYRYVVEEGHCTGERSNPVRQLGLSLLQQRR